MPCQDSEAAHTIQLYLIQGLNIQILVCGSRNQAGATIELSDDAVQYGLFEVCVVAATLFLSSASLK
jgi:hypothetical protein